MGSGHLSGVASLSSRYRIALSKWPLPCFATVSKAELFPLGELADTAARCCCESKDGRSVDDVLNA